ncbi:MAG TPA: hypothetical protein VFK06_24580 [Candidatus Angelobacter sp.]|nr:hypothetical protein [Candidatus Angelobacter sp.]
MTIITTILRELIKAGHYTPGQSFRIDIPNPPHTSLVIEDIQEQGPNGYPVISVTQYREPKKRDPEMCFEIYSCEGTIILDPFYWCNDLSGIEEYSRRLQNGAPIIRCDTHLEHHNSAALWNRTLESQGFFAAFSKTLKQEAPAKSPFRRPI